jgi:hypothetical protein
MDNYFDFDFEGYVVRYIIDEKGETHYRFMVGETTAFVVECEDCWNCGSPAKIRNIVEARIANMRHHRFTYIPRIHAKVRNDIISNFDDSEFARNHKLNEQHIVKEKVLLRARVMSKFRPALKDSCMTVDNVNIDIRGVKLKVQLGEYIAELIETEDGVEGVFTTYDTRIDLYSVLYALYDILNPGRLQ